jgi:hypothetical protein
MQIHIHKEMHKIHANEKYNKNRNSNRASFGFKQTDWKFDEMRDPWYIQAFRWQHCDNQAMAGVCVVR